MSGKWINNIIVMLTVGTLLYLIVAITASVTALNLDYFNISMWESEFRFLWVSLTFVLSLICIVEL